MQPLPDATLPRNRLTKHRTTRKRIPSVCNCSAEGSENLIYRQQMIKITFPDGSVREYAKGTTAGYRSQSISAPRLAGDPPAVAGKRRRDGRHDAPGSRRRQVTPNGTTTRATCLLGTHPVAPAGRRVSRRSICRYRLASARPLKAASYYDVDSPDTYWYLILQTTSKTRWVEAKTREVSSAARFLKPKCCWKLSWLGARHVAEIDHRIFVTETIFLAVT